MTASVFFCGKIKEKIKKLCVRTWVCVRQVSGTTKIILHGGVTVLLEDVAKRVFGKRITLIFSVYHLSTL